MSIATPAGAMAAPAPDGARRGEWISLAEAARILGVHPTSVQRAALAGSIRHRSIAGMRTRYRREDVERLAR
jgi:excisionase family DNA binding protein